MQSTTPSNRRNLLLKPKDVRLLQYLNFLHVHVFYLIWATCFNVLTSTRKHFCFSFNHLSFFFFITEAEAFA